MAGVFAAMLWGFHAMILHHAPDMFRAPQEDMSFILPVVKPDVEIPVIEVFLK